MLPLCISLQNAAFVPQHGCHACMLAKTRLFFRSEVSGEWTKWIQFQIVKRNGHCAPAIDVQEGIHAMSRNSSNNRSSNKQRKIALPLPNRVPQLRTAQGIDEACKTVLRVTAAATRLVNLMRACLDASGSGVNGHISLCIFLQKRNFTCQPHQFFQRMGSRSSSLSLVSRNQ